MPLCTKEAISLKEGDYVFIRDVRKAIEEKEDSIELEILEYKEDGAVNVSGKMICTLDSLTDEERQILLDGCLINYYKKQGEGRDRHEKF